MNSQDAILDDFHKDLIGHNVPFNQKGTCPKRILLTGGAGFIGSVLVRKLILNYPDYFILVIDKLEYCSSLNNLYPFLPNDLTQSSSPYNSSTTTDHGSRSSKSYPNFVFLQADITEIDTVQSAMLEYKIDTVIHLAAQTHVDKSFGESIEFTKNNVLGAHAMLEAARRVFCVPDFKDRSAPCLSQENANNNNNNNHHNHNIQRDRTRFIYVSTDEVYGEVALGQPDFKEDAPLAPSNPYSATKAAAECMVQAYHKSFHLPVIITRSNNVYGPFQYPEKIFPKFIMSLLNSDNTGVIPRLSVLKDSRRGSRSGGHCYIHGTGEHSRTYLYVTDVANALDVILHRGEVGQVYNIGGGHELTNIELAQDLIHRIIPRKDTANGSSSSLAPTTSELDLNQLNVVGLKVQSQDNPKDTTASVSENGHVELCIHGEEFSAARIEEADRHLKRCKQCMDRIVFVEDRAFNDRRYAVDTTKLLKLHWSPKVNFEEGITKTSE
ncbi:hypothetical protein BGZ49_002012 [Haplosporangium sp. Z 27]|nr:hypothetical protein BGZ49_002012 [Haplosporangium sp. Z 27]